MLLEIFSHIPRWVFALFIALLWLGATQLFTRTASLTRVTAPAVALTVWSLYGTATAFPQEPLTLLAWALTTLAVVALVLERPLPVGTTFDTWQRRFTLPGSAVPLALMMGIFFTKFAVGMALATQPALASSPTFALGISAVYGCFSGVFMGRVVRLWKLALQAERLGVSTVSV
jgi:hypothetical protein